MFLVPYVHRDPFNFQINVDYTEETVSVSNYPLSAALTCTKLCSAFEEGWNVL